MDPEDDDEDNLKKQRVRSITERQRQKPDLEAVY